MNNYCQVLLSFILQSEEYNSTAVSSAHHNEHSYIPRDYNGLLRVRARLSSYGDTRYLVPFIAFLGKNQEITNGYYPVFLYYRKEKKLILAYGISAKTRGEVWDFSKLGISPITIGQEFGTESHDKRYDSSFVHSVYDVSDVVDYFKNIDVTDDTNYLTHAVSTYGFETKFPIDTDLKDICDQYFILLGIAGASASGGPSAPSSSSSPSTPSTGSLIPAVSYPRNIILYGPPGTGKTYNTIRYAVAIAEGIDVFTIVNDQYTDRGGKTKNVRDTFKELTEPTKLAEPRIVFTTFHQSLSYEDFIEGIKPRYDKTAKILTYPTEPGLFKKICDEARKAPTTRFVLIIDEINRGNVAQIFGELITLIEEDKREGAKNEIKCTLPYSGERFCVPNNLYIIGTMNTADRSVEALDSALRRRFHFVEMMPNGTLVPSTSRCDEVFFAINKRISILKDSEHQIGHSYFLDVQSDEDLRDVFRFNIIPLLQEYFFGDIEKMKMVLGEGFFVKETIDPKKDFPYLSGDIDIPTEVYRLWGRDEWENCITTPSLFTDARDKLIDG